MIGNTQHANYKLPPHFPNPLIPKLQTNLQKYLDTNVSTSPHVRVEHERVKTSSRTCRGKFNYIFKKWPKLIS